MKIHALHCDICNKKCTVNNEYGHVIHYICNKCAKREPIKKQTEAQRVKQEGRA